MGKRGPKRKTDAELRAAGSTLVGRDGKRIERYKLPPSPEGLDPGERAAYGAMGDVLVSRGRRPSQSDLVGFACLYCRRCAATADDELDGLLFDAEQTFVRTSAAVFEEFHEAVVTAFARIQAKQDTDKPP